MQQLLCEPMNPPPDVDMEIPPAETGSDTIRDRLALHSSDASCSACHSRIDPAGFAFEHFDAVGGWRDAWESGIPVDASGNLEEGGFDGAAELIGMLASTDRAKRCYATRWYEYALGRPAGEEDRCALHRVQQRFLASGGDIRGLLADIAMSDSFLYRQETAP